MSRINIHNFTFTHTMASEPLFNQVSFQIDSDWKLGFIGRAEGVAVQSIATLKYYNWKKR